MRRLMKYLQNTADGVAAAMLAAMFVVFLTQIVSRYLFNLSLGWTVEVCLTLWLWSVFWVAAFCTRESDHIRFDMLYQAVNPKVQRVFSAIAALAILSAMLVALPATYDYVEFYRIKKSPVLRIPLHYVFSIFVVFMAAIAVRYIIDFIRQIRLAFSKDAQ